MSALAFLNHLANFAAPAVFVALLLALTARFVLPGKARTPSLWMQIVINSGAGMAVLAAGLAGFGNDGKMASYGALVVVCGSVQWFLGGRRQ